MDSNCYSVISSQILYCKIDGKFSLLRTCRLESNYYLNIIEIVQTCNKNSQSSGIDWDDCNINSDNNDLASVSSLSQILTIISTIPNNINNSNSHSNYNSNTIPTTIQTTFSTTIPTQFQQQFLQQLILSQNSQICQIY